MSDFSAESERGDSYNGNRVIMWNITRHAFIRMNYLAFLFVSTIFSENRVVHLFRFHCCGCLFNFVLACILCPISPVSCVRYRLCLVSDIAYGSGLSIFNASSVFSNISLLQFDWFVTDMIICIIQVIIHLLDK